MVVAVVYDSMFGNTHKIAEAIGRGLDRLGAVKVGESGDFTAEEIAAAEVLIVGSPTHLHGLPRTSTRAAAVTKAAEDDELDADHAAVGASLREWLDELPKGNRRITAAFDTRVKRPELLTGSAAKGIARRLTARGYVEIVDPESFFVDGDGPLLDGEEARAEAWGDRVAHECRVLNVL